MAFSEKYRPTAFHEVLGQTDIVRWCAAQVHGNRAQSLLLHGPTGTGKTSIALLYAQALLCTDALYDGSPCRGCQSCIAFSAGNPLNFEFRNCAEVDAEQVADLVEVARSHPLGGRRRVFLFDEAQRLSPKSFDTLLTILERPRASVFALMTTDVEKIPRTVRNRCSVHALTPIDRATSVRHLMSICRREGVDSEPEALVLLAEHAGGHVRDLVQYLEDAVENSTVTTAGVRRRFRLDFCDTLARLLQALLVDDVSTAVELIETWDDTPARKQEPIHASLVHLFTRDILRLRS